MIHESHGDLLDSDVEALVNTVNAVGVMGKGIALQFRRRFPDMFRAYERAAGRREVSLGRMHVWETEAMTGPRYIIGVEATAHLFQAFLPKLCEARVTVVGQQVFAASIHANSDAARVVLEGRLRRPRLRGG